MLQVRHFFTISETFSITDISIKYMHTRCGTRENCETVVRIITRHATSSKGDGGESVGNVCRIFGISQLANWISSLRWALLRREQSAKTVSERRGSRLGKRGSFSRALNQRESRWSTRRMSDVAPCAIKRAGVPRNRALTNLTNSHYGGI